MSSCRRCRLCTRRGQRLLEAKFKTEFVESVGGEVGVGGVVELVWGGGVGLELVWRDGVGE